MQCIIWTNPGGGLCNNLDQTWWRFVWHGIFPTHDLKKYTILQKWCSIAQSGITVRQHQCGKQARAEWPDCARCILPNIYKILPNYK